jgi:hypothetical protein
LGSAGELSTELELIVRLKFASTEDLAATQQQLARTRQMLYGLLRSLCKKRLLKRARRAIVTGFAFWLIGLALIA